MCQDGRVQSVLDVDVTEQEAPQCRVGDLAPAPSVQMGESEEDRGHHQEDECRLAHAESSQEELPAAAVPGDDEGDDDHGDTYPENPVHDLLDDSRPGEAEHHLEIGVGGHPAAVGGVPRYGRHHDVDYAQEEGNRQDGGAAHQAGLLGAVGISRGLLVHVSPVEAVDRVRQADADDDEVQGEDDRYGRTAEAGQDEVVDP